MSFQAHGVGDLRVQRVATAAGSCPAPCHTIQSDSTLVLLEVLAESPGRPIKSTVWTGELGFTWTTH